MLLSRRLLVYPGQGRVFAAADCTLLSGALLVVPPQRAPNCAWPGSTASPCASVGRLLRPLFSKKQWHMPRLLVLAVGGAESSSNSSLVNVSSFITEVGP